MISDFYCEEVLSGRTPVEKVAETEDVLAYHHTKPFYPVHIVAIPKKHIASLTEIEENDHSILLELMTVIKEIAAQVLDEHKSCKVITNLGKYQDSKHLHWHIVSGEPLIQKQ
ncbi:HIT domain-containing protein [Rossellomorea aquimaris]|uniref:HIT domain-containing protein n=1 Tax=Rossellomorea aquimaris TaxID=189382 RepID=A0A5D4TY29_9BACI|nr:HIT domain-containing protein [Rossellomorea aquimaris]TYS79893.1 HIT domain-containing protein [Rossellomorea aquimaris]